MQNDLEINNSGEMVTSTKIPEADGMNACVYLTLGISSRSRCNKLTMFKD